MLSRLTNWILAGCFGLLLSFAQCPVRAQVFTLHEALEIAQTNYPSIKANQAAVHASDEEKDAVANRYIPRVSLQHQYTYGTSNSVAGAFYPNAGTVLSPSGGIRPENIYQGAFGSYTSGLLEWDVINFGKIAEEVKAAELSTTAAKASLQNEVFQHSLRVADSYLQLLINKKLAFIQKKNVARAFEFKRSVDAGVIAGIRPGVDSSLANAEYVKARIMLIESERNEQSQRNRLIQLLGLRADTEFAYADSLNFLSSLPILAGADSSHLPVHPLLTVQKARADLAQQRGLSTRRSFLPSISVTAAAWGRGSGISNADESYRTDFSSGTAYQVYNYMFGVSTRWVITDFASINNRFKSQQFVTQQQQSLYEEQALELERQNRDAATQFRYMKQQADFAPIQLTAARHAYNQARARYESGLTDLPTYLQAMLSLSRAEADLTITFSNTWRALLMMAAANGDLQLFLGQLND